MSTHTLHLDRLKRGLAQITDLRGRDLGDGNADFSAWRGEMVRSLDALLPSADYAGRLANIQFRDRQTSYSSRILRHDGYQRAGLREAELLLQSAIEEAEVLHPKSGGDAEVPSVDAADPDAFAHAWAFLHPEIRELARPRLASGQRADAVEAALKHVNELVQRRCRQLTGKELDGSKLMKTMFSVDKPVIAFGDLSTDTGRSMQVGYMELFSGAMTGIRNPKAHANIEVDLVRAMHFLFLASLLRTKLDETVIDNRHIGVATEATSSRADAV